MPNYKINCMQIKSIFVNLPVRDIKKTKSFWTALGFQFNPKFTDDKALALILKEGSIYAMFLHADFFKTFTDRPIADGSTTQVLNAIEVDSREAVNALVKKALEIGAKEYSSPRDHGWMYQHAFADLDGHQWEVFWSDESKLPDSPDNS